MLFRSQIHAEMQATPPATVPHALTPVSGTVRARFFSADKSLRDVQATLELPGATLRAEGSMQAAASSMKLALDATRLESIRPPAELFWSGFGALPVQLDGAIHAESNWTGGWKEADFTGPVKLTGIVYNQTRWESLSGTLTAHRRVIESRENSAADRKSTRLNSSH